MTSHLQERIRALPGNRLAGMRRGIEKEGLRVLAEGGLALTPHPAALGPRSRTRTSRPTTASRRSNSSPARVARCGNASTS